MEFLTGGAGGRRSDPSSPRFEKDGPPSVLEQTSLSHDVFIFETTLVQVTPTSLTIKFVGRRTGGPPRKAPSAIRVTADFRKFQFQIDNWLGPDGTARSVGTARGPANCQFEIEI